MAPEPNRALRAESPIRSRKAAQFADAFERCGEWSEVRLERQAGGRRVRVAVDPPPPTSPRSPGAPYDWAAD